ncbi:TetR/AcrR family transcriptional regulator [Nocardia vulneris]|uniref:TetR family transcriptional regulator n=1 Tax=Nocardia vulneris TaxID=1141657 RepID=A0ABR4ZKQ5_9NOCA|nr:TetR/AcrR family transcriptional regulator [Nocardia vulneris]KIA65991.1 TetR family transcriptional regulator [Nocardia vulneris]
MASRREAILRASAKAIAERGVRGLRVHDVAEAAGVSPGLLYYYFKDRDGLLAAALTYINDRARESGTASEGSDSPLDRLHAHALADIQDEPEVFENALVWHELRASAVFEMPLRAPLATTSRQWDAEIADAIRLAQAAGDVPQSVDPKAMGLIVTALTDGLSARWLSGELSTEQARAHLTIALKALLPATNRASADQG